MPDPVYRHVTSLDDPAKPYKRVYLCEATSVYVKVHAARREPGLGKVRWDITGSLCDETGKALRDENGEALICMEAHGLSVQTDTGIRYADARDILAELISDDTPETIARVRARARALFQAKPTDLEVRDRMIEDFERELLFMVAKVERAALNRQWALDLGGVKAA